MKIFSSLFSSPAEKEVTQHSHKEEHFINDLKILFIASCLGIFLFFRGAAVARDTPPPGEFISVMNNNFPRLYPAHVVLVWTISACGVDETTDAEILTHFASNGTSDGLFTRKVMHLRLSLVSQQNWRSPSLLVQLWGYVMKIQVIQQPSKSATLQAQPHKPFVIFQSTLHPCLFQLHPLPSSQTHSLVKSQSRLFAGGLRLLSRWTLSSLTCGWQIHSDFFPAFRFTLSGWNEVWQIFAIYHRSSAQFSGEASGLRPHQVNRSLTRNWILKSVTGPALTPIC